MAITNPSWNLTNADVTRLRNARDILLSILPLWGQDARYSASVGEVGDAARSLDSIAQRVEDYLAVQGT